MKNKIDYSSIFTPRKDGRYQGFWHDESKVRHAIYDRDPEALYYKIKEKEKPHAVTFREVAEVWQVEHVEQLARGSQATYKAPLEDMIRLHGRAHC